MDSDKVDGSYPPLVWVCKKTISSAVHSVKKLPDILPLRLKFGLFCQFPFPKKEMLKSEGWAMDTAISLLDNDAIGFKSKDSVDNFLQFSEGVLKLEVDYDNFLVKYKKRKIKLCTAPIALPIDRYEKLLRVFLLEMDLPPFETSFILRADLLTEENAMKMKRRFAEFDKLIRTEPRIRGLVTFMQVLLARDEKTLNEHQPALDQVVWKINRKFGRSKWTPIIVVFGSEGRPDLKPFYKELDYLANFGLEERGLDREFLMFEMMGEQQKILVFSPFIGVTHQMKEAYLRAGKHTEITDQLYKELLMGDKERMDLFKKLSPQPVPFMKEYLMRYLLFVADNVVVIEMEEMKPVTMACLDEMLSSRVEGDKPITLILDFDGTLLPSANSEEEEVLSGEMMNALQQMSLHPRIQIIFVSGRDAATVRDMLQLDDAFYIGNHGFSVIYPDGNKWSYPLNKEFNRIIDLMDDLYSEACLYGAYVVNHGASLIFHYRHVLPVYRKSLFVKAWIVAKAHGFEVSNWNRCLEIRLPVNVSKGQTCEKAIEHLYGENWTDKTHIIYVGDQKSDETAMRILSSETTITGLRVTNGHFPRSVADMKLPSHESVLIFLRWLHNKVPTVHGYSIPSYYAYTAQDSFVI